MYNKSKIQFYLVHNSLLCVFRGLNFFSIGDFVSRIKNSKIRNTNYIQKFDKHFKLNLDKKLERSDSFITENTCYNGKYFQECLVEIKLKLHPLFLFQYVLELELRRI